MAENARKMCLGGGQKDTRGDLQRNHHERQDIHERCSHYCMCSYTVGDGSRVLPAATATATGTSTAPRDGRCTEIFGNIKNSTIKLN